MTAREAAKVLNISVRHARRLIKKLGIKPIGTIFRNGNQVNDYDINDLPADWQDKITNFPPDAATTSAASSAEELTAGKPATPAGRYHLHDGGQVALQQGISGPALRTPLNIPQKATTIAKARLDLLRAWEQYRQKPQKLPLFDSKRPLKDMDAEFEAGFNSGNLLSHLYSILGTVSIETLYRWKSSVNGSGDWAALIPQSYCRDNPITSLSMEESSTFLKFLLHHNKLKIGTAIRLTQAALESRGLQTQRSPMAFRRFADWFRTNHYDRWVLMREGQKALKDKVEPYILRDPSLLNVGDVLVADGHRLDFQIINPFTGRPCRAIIVGYVDWKSYDLAGYEIMIEESTQCIASALRSSVLRLGKVPAITYQDNGKAFRARFFTSGISFEESGLYGLFARLGIIPVFAQPYNARAKIIERWFKEFSDTFERLLPSFTGASIQDKPAWMLRNEKLHKALHKEYVPTISETIDLLEAWLQYHRSRPCPHEKEKTVGMVFDEGRGQGMDTIELDDLMMDMKKATIGRNGIRFLNADYYDENLYGLREEVMVRYSLFDLSAIKVYDRRGEFICSAKRVMPVHPMANYLGDVKDVEALKRQISQQRRLERRTIQLAKEMIGCQGKAPELDWQRIAETSPTVIEKLEAQEITLPAVSLQIPDECLGGEQKVESEEVNDSSLEDIKRPTFTSRSERYFWLQDHPELTNEADIIFKAEFEISEDPQDQLAYRMGVKFFEDQGKAIDNASGL